MAQNWQTIQIPFGSGLSQKSDTRADQPPGLDKAIDVQFDETSGLQTRKPFAALGVNIFGGGTLSSFRQVFSQDGELLCFTDVGLYSWNAKLSKWVLRGTHLAVKIEETSRFGSPGDQYDCDRAELGNTIVYVWVNGSAMYAGAIDKTTGSVLMPVTAVVGIKTQPRLVATTTKIMLFGVNTGLDLVCISIDPFAPATAVTSGSTTTVLAAASFNVYYDVCRWYGNDGCVVAARRQTTTSYSVMRVTAALAVSASVKARTCDSLIAISSDPVGTSAQIVRTNGLGLVGDQVNISVLSDLFTNQPLDGWAFTITDTLLQLTAAHRLVQDSGAYRCYYFSSCTQAISYGWIDTANNSSTVGSPTPEFPPSPAESQAGIGIPCLDIASRAFAYGGNVFVHLQFAGLSAPVAGGGPFVQAQNTCFLYRDDGLLVAKEAMARAAGFVTAGAYSATKGRLPNVTLVSGSTGYAWCVASRRILDLGSSQKGYSARAPRDIIITFDSNAARRSALSGRTAYIAGGEVMQYDGNALVECGFHLYPYGLQTPTGSGVGIFQAGTYTWKSTWRWDNARGERERSTTATYVTAAIVASKAKAIGAAQIGLIPTHKTATGGKLAIEIWRNEVDAPVDAPYFLVTSVDPSTVGSVNGYFANGSTSQINDALDDATLITLEANPENGSVTEALSPPAASIIIGTQDRVYLAGIADDPSAIWYSRLRDDGSIASFNDGNIATIPSEAGAITALALHEDTLIAWTATATYALTGTGLDNTGSGSNFGPARILSTDCGAANQESVARTPMGHIFKGSKGWYLLRGWDVTYIGAAVVDYDNETILAVHVMEAQHQVRCLSASRMIVYDYVANQWAEWSISDGLGACIWNGTYVYLSSSGVKVEQSTYASLTYGIDVETPWIKLNDLQGAGRVRRILALGEHRSTHALRVRIARDYQFGTAVAAMASTDELVARFPAPPNTRYSSPLTTSAGIWAAKLTLVATGDAGNAVTFSVLVQSTGGASSVTVHDNQIYDDGSSSFTACANNVGVSIKVNASSPPTVATLEAAINASSALAQVTNADLHQTATIVGNVVGVQKFKQFANGCDATTATYFDDKPWASTPAVVGGPLQVAMGAKRQRCESIKVRLTAVSEISTVTSGMESITYGAPTGEALKLTGLGLEVGVDQGLHRRLPAAQKAG